MAHLCTHHKKRGLPTKFKVPRVGTLSMPGDGVSSKVGSKMDANGDDLKGDVEDDADPEQRHLRKTSGESPRSSMRSKQTLRGSGGTPRAVNIRQHTCAVW
jgi:hypothetical protein